MSPAAPLSKGGRHHPSWGSQSPQPWASCGKSLGELTREESSPAEDERLSTGPVLEVHTPGKSSGTRVLRSSTFTFLLEQEILGERLRYLRLSGTGPPTGWVSLRVKEKPMLQARALSRKLRVLALHGAPSNSNVMKFQSAALRKVAGEDFEWIFLDGPCEWQPVPGATQMNFAERTAMEKAIAKEKPFVQWYSHPLPKDGEAAGGGAGGPMTFDGVIYEKVQASVDFLEKSLAADADVVVAFSQGGTMLAIYMDEMRKALRPVQWRLGVFFCGAMIDDEDFQLLDKLPLPALYIHGGDTDPWGRHGEKMLPKMYTELEMSLRCGMAGRHRWVTNGG